MTYLANGIIEYYVCPVCGARVNQLRRGRCTSCYQAWMESQPVAVGASCRVCGERRRAHLQRVELLGRWFTMCHICAYRSVRLDPMPPHIEGVRAELARDRRFTDRREDRADPRTFKRERRVGERRVILLSESDLLYDDEDMFLDYDEPIEGEVTGVFQKVTREELVAEGDPADVQLEL
jgi:hypothetical protein